MRNKNLKIIGASLILLGLSIFFLKPLSGITGFTISENISQVAGIWIYALGLCMMILGIEIFIAGGLEKSTRDEIVRLGLNTLRKKRGWESYADSEEEESAKLQSLKFARDSESAADYENLKGRLQIMEENSLIGVDKDTPSGVYLSPRELLFIKTTILKYLPKELAEKNVVIGVGGSLSRKKKGKRHTEGKYGDNSDEFYLSDVDIGIEGIIPFEYINHHWTQAIKRSGEGRGAGEETLKISSHLTERERRENYMAFAPEWIRAMIYELNEHEYANKKRPVNLKFYKNMQDQIPQDIIYVR